MRTEPSTSTGAASDTERSRNNGRRPDATVAIGSTRVSGWNSDDKGWSFMASRTYRDQSGKTQYSEMTLYSRDVLNLAACLQRMADHVMAIHTNGEERSTQ